MSLASHAPAGIAVPHPPPRPRHTPLSFSSWGLEGGLFTLSAALLALEILQTKIFAFSLEPTAMSIAIAVCLLGLGALLYLIALLTVPFPRAAPTPILPRADTDGSPRRGARRRAP